MLWDQIGGMWKQLKGEARVKWGQITDDEWDEIAGNREKMIGKIQQRYGMAKDQVERDVDDWVNGLGPR